MAPSKFGLFKSRSRDQPEQPSTENLLNSISSDTLPTESPTLPIAPSDEFVQEKEDVNLSLQDLCIEDAHETPILRRRSQQEGTTDYKQFKDDTSTITDATSISTLQDEDSDTLKNYDMLDAQSTDGASTSCDVVSIQLDKSSIAASEDVSVNCAGVRRTKKSKLRKDRIMRDYGMWHASNMEVMQNLLSKSGTYDDQIKWEAIATARGLCTLTDNCTCPDCRHAKYLAGMADGDGGLGTAPLFGAMSFGCTLQ